MASVADSIALGIKLQQAGRLGDAEQIYRQMLLQEPTNAAAWQLLGTLAFQQGDGQVAIAYFQRALQLEPTYAEALNNLGLVLQSRNESQAAIDHFRRAIAAKPDFAEPFLNLGNSLKKEGHVDSAIACFRRAIELRPELSEAHYTFGITLWESGKLAEAAEVLKRAIPLTPPQADVYCKLGDALFGLGELEDAAFCYRRAIELQPEFIPGQYNLGMALKDLERFNEAAECFSKALALAPNLPEAHYNLAYVLREQGNFQAAEHHYHETLRLRPNWPEALCNLGETLDEMERLDEAVTFYQAALERKPDLVEAIVNLGNTRLAQRQIEVALSHYDRALELNTNHASAHFSRAVLRLLSGNLEEGWQEYEWRWKTGKFHSLQFSQPRWFGEPLEGKTILLHAEQGFGDTIQFSRYAALLKQRGATVVFECQERLLKLLSGVAGVDRLIGRGSELPEFDFYVPLLSVPGVLNTTVENIPSDIPYLFADQALVALWSKRLKDVRGFRIGINWRGRPGIGAWKQRDVPLESFKSLATVPGASFVNLQKGATRDELAKLREILQVTDFGSSVDEENGAFMDTAAIIKNLDLIITSDTSLPHLAGALGVPVWLALPYLPDWRWLLDRSDSPWYPTMRLFRQKSAGDWVGVFDEIQYALHDQVQAMHR